MAEIRKRLVTEAELMSASITEDGDLEFTRDSGVKINAGQVRVDVTPEVAAARDEAVAAAERAEAVPTTSDTIMASIAANAGSAFAGELSAKIAEIAAPVTYFASDYAEVGDTSDVQAVQRAYAAAKAAGLPSVIQLPARDVYFDTFASLAGSMSDCTIRGYGEGVTIVRVHASASAPIAGAFVVPIAAGGTITNLTFEDFTIHGGMVSAPAGLARDERVFGAGYFTMGIRVNGRGVPGSPETRAIVNGVTVRRVTVFGVKDLPVLVEGASNFTTDWCTFERTLDFGVTYTDGVTVTNNVSLWSGDNGFSLSRGCTNVVATGNRVYGCHRWAYWVAGFADEVGPVGFSLVGNQADLCAWGGVFAGDAPRNGTIAGNTISNVLRGYIGTSNYGVGIYVSGMSDGTAWAESITVSGNTLVDCARGGVMVRSYSRGVNVVGNLIIRPGSEKDELGSTISATNTDQNFGVAAIAGAADLIVGTLLADNYTHDDRATPYMNHPVAVSSEVAETVQRHFNSGVGGRDMNDYTVLGSPLSKSAVLRLTGVTSSGRALQFANGTTVRTALRQNDSTGLFLSVYSDGGSAVNVAKLRRTNPALEIMSPAMLAPYATGSRPAAASYVGGMIYDSTLGKAILSNGTAWVNLDGTAL